MSTYQRNTFAYMSAGVAGIILITWAITGCGCSSSSQAINTKEQQELQQQINEQRLARLKAYEAYAEYRDSKVPVVQPSKNTTSITYSKLPDTYNIGDKYMTDEEKVAESKAYLKKHPVIHGIVKMFSGMARGAKEGMFDAMRGRAGYISEHPEIIPDLQKSNEQIEKQKAGKFKK
jgi:hypothetical protein